VQDRLSDDRNIESLAAGGLLRAVAEAPALEGRSLPDWAKAVLPRQLTNTTRCRVTHVNGHGER
jgi:hypothetical protein